MDKVFVRSEMDRQIKDPNIFVKLAVPNGGWVKAVREAIGMPQRVLGSRLSVSQAAVAQLEDRESSGGVTISSMYEAAEALDCVFVYGIIPKRESYETLVEDQALKVASSEMDRISHTMALEAQEVDESRTFKIRTLKGKDIINIKRIWN